MTSRKWRRCKDPIKMVAALKSVASDRKGRLYLCGGCRTIWHLLYDFRSQRAVEVAEQFADGIATEEERFSADWFAEIPAMGYDFMPGEWRKWHPDGSIPPAGFGRAAYIGREDLPAPREAAMGVRSGHRLLPSRVNAQP